MGDGDPGVGGRRHPGGHPGHHLELDPGRAQGFALLAAAPEHERVAALEADDAAPRARRLDQALGDLLLRHRRPARLLADVDELGVVAGAVEGARGDQAVVEDRVGGADQLQRPRRHQARVAGPGADQVDDPAARAHRGRPRIAQVLAPEGSRRARGSRAPRPPRAARRAAPRPPPAARPRARPGRGPTRCRPGARRRHRSRGARPRARRGPRSGWRRSRRGSRRPPAPRSARPAPARRRSPPPPRSPRRPRPGPAAPAPPAPQPASSPRPGSRTRPRPRGPSRRSPAAARTIASRSPSASRRSLVSTLPCSSPTSRSGRAARSWARRRRLAVPTRAPSGTASSEEPAPIQTSAGSSRSGTAAIARPSGIVGRQVLGRVDADLGLARQQRRLDPADEPGLVAQLAVGGDLDQLSPAEQPGDPLGLGERQGTPPGREANRHPRP